MPGTPSPRLAGSVDRVSSGIRNLVVSVPTEELAADLGELPAGVELVVWPMDAAAAARPLRHGGAAVHVDGAGARRDSRTSRSGSCRASPSATTASPTSCRTGLTFANAASVHETSTAELAVGLAIAAQRHIDAFAVDTAAGRWAPVFAQSLADRRVLLLGYGGVGKAVAARLAPFEVELTPVASRARDEDGVAVHGIDELPALLPQAEIVVLTLPGGSATQNVVDDAFLSALPDGALVINVGRGSLIDTDALVDHVRRGRIRAALDVTDPEPLPDGHPLWSLPGVLITPHVGGASSAMRPRVAKLVRTQIERLAAGEPPINVVLGG